MLWLMSLCINIQPVNYLTNPKLQQIDVNCQWNWCFFDTAKAYQLSIKHSFSLIHHQGVICVVAFDLSSLRRIVHTPQSSILGALHLTPSWCPGIDQNPTSLLMIQNLGGGFWDTRLLTLMVLCLFLIGVRVPGRSQAKKFIFFWENPPIQVKAGFLKN